jgi:hypothetical protein
MNLQAEAFHTVTTTEVRLGRFYRSTSPDTCAGILSDEKRHTPQTGSNPAQRGWFFRNGLRAVFSLRRHGHSSAAIEPTAPRVHVYSKACC